MIQDSGNGIIQTVFGLEPQALKRPALENCYQCGQRFKRGHFKDENSSYFCSVKCCEDFNLDVLTAVEETNPDAAHDGLDEFMSELDQYEWRNGPSAEVLSPEFRF